MIDFPHKAPEGYSYEIEHNFKRNIDAVWLCHNCSYDYNLGKPVRTIWGFYNSKTKTYLAPVNSKTVGKTVSLDRTTPYSAMPIKYRGVEKYFV